jgi:hypothetical protein
MPAPTTHSTPPQVVAEFSTHNVLRQPSIAYDRADGRFLLSAVSFDSNVRDPGIGGRLLLAASTESNPTGLWRVMSLPTPPCEVGLYAVPDLAVASSSTFGVHVSLVLRCYDPQTRALKSSAPRIMAVDKVGRSQKQRQGDTATK